MSEQTYMNLKDAVKRPVFDAKTINRENPRFKSLVDSYQKWNETEGYYEETRSIYEDDIIKCLCHYNLDGYNLAEYLKMSACIEPDSELVDILDDVLYVKDSLTKQIIGQWTKENFLEIPSDVIGKKVNVKQGDKKYENHYITTIRPDTYEVTISDNINKKGGWIIKYEDVTFVDFPDETL
jgi:hypothetical protein